MGTRHLICVFWKGKWFLAQYGQFDGYPEGQGAKIVKFLSVARNIENLKTGLEHHIYEPTREELEAIRAECDAWDENRRDQGLPYEYRIFGVNQLYPSLARETSAGLLSIIARAGAPEEEGASEETKEAVAEEKPKKEIPVTLELEFANDTLFCEWAYVVDLDNEVLEVYGGGEKKHDGHRFKDVGDERAPVPAFICSFKFSEIFLMKTPQEFIYVVMAACDKRNEEYSAREKAEEDGSDGSGSEEEEDAEGAAVGSAPASP
ncbi:hypothetical protein VTI74DRAFT_456 [Chaetomium olivicolor]